MKYPVLSALSLAIGCGASSPEPAPPAAPATTPADPAPAPPPPAADKERDRAAILAMAGEFEVKFHFQETVALTEGYELWAPYQAEATELIEVIEDTGDHISMQHILVLGDSKRVVKHWRQDWTFEDDGYYEYKGHRRWERRILSPAERAGTWTQRVYQVDDSPRYASHGRWVHQPGGTSSWQSQPTWRPLPRRDYTRRSDYHVLVATNRHTLTRAGWVHEQDNAKLVLDDKGAPVKLLAREVGLNTYKRTEGLDLTAGRTYWAETQGFWADVRAAWSRWYQTGEPVVLEAEVDGKPMWRHMFDLAGEVREAKQYDRAVLEPKIAAVLDAFRKG